MLPFTGNNSNIVAMPEWFIRAIARRSDSKSPSGKLRLLYEVSPLSMVCEQAGGAATDGERRILEVVPDELHQRVPCYMGNKEYVELARECISG